MDLIDATQSTSLPGTMARKRALELADTLIRDFADPVHGGEDVSGHTGEGRLFGILDHDQTPMGLNLAESAHAIVKHAGKNDADDLLAIRVRR